MTRRHIIILVGISLTIIWLGVVYLVLQMPKSNPGPFAVSPTPQYMNHATSPSFQVVGMKNGTIRITTRPAQRPTHVTLPKSTSSSEATSPFTHLGSNATMKSVGSGIVLGSGQGSEGTSSAGARGIVYTSSSHSWVGFVNPVAAQDIAYVPSNSGELPDNDFRRNIRLAPPTEDGSGTNGPNIEIEQPIGEGLWLLLCAAIGYMLVIYRRKERIAL